MTKSIRQLYNEGQRQFPMRGGGISPELIIWGHHFQAKNDKAQAGRAFQCVAWRTFDGTNLDGFHALDLLPEPLPDPSRLERIEKALEPIMHYIKMREEKPFRGLSDDVHMIHGGTEWEAVLRLSDLRKLATAIGGE